MSEYRPTENQRPKKETPEEREARLEREEEKALYEKALALAIENLLKQPEFKLFMKHILTKGGIMQSVMTGNSWTHYKSGRQDFTREIWADLALVDQQAAMNLLLTKNRNES